MEIRPSEVESIKVIGTLNGQEVKLIKCIGGFYCAVGAKSKNKKLVEPLAAGSHIALVAHQLEKQYKGDYHPAMFKSEAEVLPTVSEFTQKLPLELVNEGYEIFTLTKNEVINLVATKLGAEVLNFSCTKSGKSMEVEKVVNASKEVESKKMATVVRVFTDILNGN